MLRTNSFNYTGWKYTVKQAGAILLTQPYSFHSASIALNSQPSEIIFIVQFHSHCAGIMGGLVTPASLYCPLAWRILAWFNSGSHDSRLKSIAVGMPVARHPPHRSVRGGLLHTAPTSGQTRRRTSVLHVFASGRATEYSSSVPGFQPSDLNFL